MPKVNDIKAYWKEVAQKAGLSEDQSKAVSAAMDDDKFAKAFAENFKPLPDYSHDLNDVKEKTKGERDAEIQAYYTKQNQTYQEYLKAIEERDRYKTQFGELGDNGTGNGNGNGNGTNSTTLTRADLDKLLAQQKADFDKMLSQRENAYLSFRDADHDYRTRFNKTLDRTAFEEAWKKNINQWGGDLYHAYEKFIAPEVEKAETAKWEAKIAAAREEGIRDGYSRRAMPADTQAKSFSPMFDRKEDVSKLSEREQEAHSRDA